MQNSNILANICYVHLRTEWQTIEHECLYFCFLVVLLC